MIIVIAYKLWKLTKCIQLYPIYKLWTLWRYFYTTKQWSKTFGSKKCDPFRVSLRRNAFTKFPQTAPKYAPELMLPVTKTYRGLNSQHTILARVFPCHVRGSSQTGNPLECLYRQPPKSAENSRALGDNRLQ